MSRARMARQRDVGLVLDGVQLILARGQLPEDILARLEAVAVAVDLEQLLASYEAPAGASDPEVGLASLPPASRRRPSVVSDRGGKATQ